MTLKALVEDGRRAARIRAANQALDLVVADVQSAGWADDRDGDESLLACHTAATDYLDRAAGAVDLVAPAHRRQHPRYLLGSTAGMLIVTVAAVAWTPAAASGAVTAVGLALWWILAPRLLRRPVSSRALAALQARFDIDSSGPVGGCRAIIREITAIASEPHPASGAGWPRAVADLQTAAGLLGLVVGADATSHD